MIEFQPGEWANLSVTVNSRNVLDYEGKVYLKLDQDQLSIHPVGLHFRIDHVVGNQARLISDGRRYDATFDLDDSGLLLTMDRLDAEESVVIAAQLEAVAV